jgi:hypothetical protein
MQAVLDNSAVTKRLGAGPDDELLDIDRGDESGFSPLYVAANEGIVRAACYVCIVLLLLL